MADVPPQLHVAEISSGQGVLTARVLGSAIEQHRGHALVNAVRNAVDEAGDVRHVVLDLEDVTFVNSSGLAAFIEMHNEFKERGIHSVAYRPGKDLLGILSSVRLSELYTIVQSAAELEQALSGQS